MVASIVIQGVVTRDPVYRSRQRMIEGVLIDQLSATFSVYCDRVYYRVTCGLPRLIAFLEANNVEDGSSVVVSGRLKIDSYTNNRGVRASSFDIIAQRIRLDTQVRLQVNSAGVEDTESDITATELVARLRTSNLIARSTMAELNGDQRIILEAIKTCSLVVHSNAHAEDLLGRLPLELCQRIVRRDSSLSPEEFVVVLPDGVSLSQARTFLEEILPPVASENSSRVPSRASHATEMEE